MKNKIKREVLWIKCSRFYGTGNFFERRKRFMKSIG